MGTYDGLAPCLYGESNFIQATAASDFITLTGASSQSGDFLVCEDSSGTEKVWINADGCIYSRGSTVTATAYNGFDGRGAVAATATGTWFCEVGARLTTALVSTSGAQQYALMGRLIATGTNSGGRDAVLELSYSWGNSQTAGACGFIDFNTEDTLVPTFFTIHNVTADASGGMFVTNTATATHGLKCYIQASGGQPVLYYLMLTSSHS